MDFRFATNPLLATSETGGGRGSRAAFVLARACIDGTRVAAFVREGQPATAGFAAHRGCFAPRAATGSTASAWSQTWRRGPAASLRADPCRVLPSPASGRLTAGRRGPPCSSFVVL